MLGFSEFGSLNTKNWRLTPGYLNQGYSDFESVHILLGRFLADRHSENPLPEKSLLSANHSFDWDQNQPLEKVINSQEDFEFLMKHPRLFLNAIAIIEPWNHVGQNPLGEIFTFFRSMFKIARCHQYAIKNYRMDWWIFN